MGGFSFLVFLNPWASILKFLMVFCFGNHFLFKSILAGCERPLPHYMVLPYTWDLLAGLVYITLVESKIVVCNIDSSRIKDCCFGAPLFLFELWLPRNTNVARFLELLLSIYVEFRTMVLINIRSFQLHKHMYLRCGSIKNHLQLSNFWSK